MLIISREDYFKAIGKSIAEENYQSLEGTGFDVELFTKDFFNNKTKILWK